MANPRGTEADLGQAAPTFQADIQPPAPPLRGTPDTARDFSRVAGTFEGLSNQLGQLADTAAAGEGASAGKTAGLDPNYRPTGDDVTIRGRAFNQAATATYANNLQAQSRDALNTASDQYNQLPMDQRQPSVLADNIKKIQGDFEQNHVFPEIMGQFRDSFSSLASVYLRQAQTNYQNFTIEQSKASLLGNLNSLNNTAGRMAAAGTPEAAAQLDTLAAQRKGMVAAAVNSGVVDPVAGQKLTTSAEQQDHSSLILAQAAQLAPDKRQTFADALDADYKASGPLTKGLDTDTYTYIQGKIAAQNRADASVAKATTRDNVAEIKGVQTMLVKGQPPTDPEWGALTQKYGATPDIDTAQAFDTLKAIRGELAGFRGQRPEAIEAMLANAQSKGVTPQMAPLIDAGNAYLERLRHDLATDPVGRAAKDGVIQGVNGLVFANPQTLAAGLTARIPQAQQAAAFYGLAAPKFLLPGEADLFKSTAAQGGPRMVQLATAAAQAMGPQLPMLLREIGGDAPKFATIARIGSWNGDPGLLNDLAERQRLNNDPAAKGTLELPPQTRADPILNDTYGTALSAIPDMNAAARTATRDGYEVRALRENLPKAVDSNAAQAEFARTAQQAVGATFEGATQYGGVARYQPPGWYSHSASKILAPLPMQADGVGTAIAAVTDADLKAMPQPPVAGDGKTPFGAAQLQSAYLKPQGHGVYWVAQNDPDGQDPKWVMQPNGQRFTLDLNTLEPALRSRVPALYKGAPTAGAK